MFVKICTYTCVCMHLCIVYSAGKRPLISQTPAHCNTLQHTATHCNTSDLLQERSVNVYTCKCICIHMCVYVCMYVCMGIAIQVLYILNADLDKLQVQFVHNDIHIDMIRYQYVQTAPICTNCLYILISYTY